MNKNHALARLFLIARLSRLGNLAAQIAYTNRFFNQLGSENAFVR